MGEALETNEQVLDLTMYEPANKEGLALLGDLVAGFTHEINTPLAVVVTVTSYSDNMHRNIYELFRDNHLSKKLLDKYLMDMSRVLRF